MCRWEDIADLGNFQAEVAETESLCYLGLLDHGDSLAYMDSPEIWGANFAVKSEMFNKYGLFDPNLGRIPGKLYAGEETEFLHRLQNTGEKKLYDPSLIIYHSVSAHRMSKSTFASGGSTRGS